MTKPAYIELHAASAFSFLEAASQPEALIERAAELEIPTVALLDRNGVYGAPRFYVHGKEKKINTRVGAEVSVSDLGFPRLTPPDWLPPPTQTLSTCSESQRELSTEEQIAFLREQADKEEQAPARAGHRTEAWWAQQQRPQLERNAAYADVKRAKAVRFAPGQAQMVTSARRRSSTTAPKKRSPTVRRNLVELGQQ